MKKNKIKILFVLPLLSFGGAERVLLFLSQNVNKNKFDSELIVLGKETDNGYNTSSLKVHYLNSSRVLKSIPKLILKIHQSKPHIVIGTISHVNLVLGTISYLFPKVSFVGRQTSITKIYKELDQNKRIDWFSFFLKNALKKLDFIICQSQDMVNDCIELYHLKKNKLIILNNPITDTFVQKNKVFDTNKILKFITVGRFVEVKGHKRILRILKSLDKPFVYTLIGDGPLKGDIFQDLNRLGLTESIKYIPYSNEVASHLVNNDFFLQGSLSEGFPNALLESCAVGTPAIAFDAPGGTKEIIEDGVNGFLVQTEEEFLERLNNLPNLDPKIVSESVYKKFDKAIILKKYENFFLEIVKKK